MQATIVKKKPKMIITSALLIANAKNILVPIAKDILAHCFAIAINGKSVAVSFMLKCFVFQSYISKK